MEEQQIRDFVQRVSSDVELRESLAADPERVIAREGFSPRVARIITRLVPHLTLNQNLEASSFWW